MVLRLRSRTFYIGVLIAGVAAACAAGGSESSSNGSSSSSAGGASAGGNSASSGSGGASVSVATGVGGGNNLVAEVFGHGPDQPIASNDNEAGRAENRRIEFEVVPLEESLR